MAAQFVTSFRKSRTLKNDRNDAEAIATAARQGNMRFVAIKSVEQQARLKHPLVQRPAGKPAITVASIAVFVNKVVASIDYAALRVC